MVGKYQKPYPWYKFGVDLIMGSTADKKAVFSDRMFLPIDLKNELSESFVYRSGKMIPLLQNPEVLLDFGAPEVKQMILFYFSAIYFYTCNNIDPDSGCFDKKQENNQDYLILSSILCFQYFQY